MRSVLAEEYGSILTERALYKSLCRRSFYDFVQYFWDVVIHEEPVWNWHIEYICYELSLLADCIVERKPKPYDLIINVPPGTSKSTICSVMFPAWLWAKDPTIRVLCGSYSFPLGLDLSVRCRDIVTSEKFKDLFGDVKLRSDMATKTYFTNTKGGSRYTTSTGGSVTGMHGHVIIVDDPIDPMGVSSLTGVQSVNDWYDGTLSSRKIDKQNTPTIVIMQRLGVEDLTGHLLKNERNVRLICLPGNLDFEVYPTKLKKYYKKTGGLLDPRRLPKDVLEEAYMTLGPSRYSAQYGQSPITKLGSFFETEKFKIVDTVPSKILIDKVVRYWDKAGTEDGDGAKTAGVKIIRLKDGGYIVQDVVSGRWRASDREQHIKATAERDGKDVRVLVEQEPGSGGKESAENTIKMLSGYIVKADRPSGDKTRRAEPWSSQVNAGNVSLIRAAWNDEFVNEHAYFPNSKLKDQVDAASGAFAELSGIKNKRKKVRAL